MGGKLLTNLLKETVSYRAWNMLDETYIMNDVKEKLCYVSLDFEREINAAKSVHHTEQSRAEQDACMQRRRTRWVASLSLRVLRCAPLTCTAFCFAFLPAPGALVKWAIKSVANTCYLMGAL